MRWRTDRINVGWIDVGQTFDKGLTPEWFAGALLDIAAGPSRAGAQ